MSGLFAGLMLRRHGFAVDIYERVESELAGRGAGIVAQPVVVETLRRLGIGDGERILVESRHGAFSGPALLTDSVRAGEIFAVFHDARAFVNRVTGPGRDPLTDTPEYKVTAVRVSRQAP